MSKNTDTDIIGMTRRTVLALLSTTALLFVSLVLGLHVSRQQVANLNAEQRATNARYLAVIECSHSLFTEMHLSVADHWSALDGLLLDFIAGESLERIRLRSDALSAAAVDLRDARVQLANQIGRCAALGTS